MKPTANNLQQIKEIAVQMLGRGKAKSKTQKGMCYNYEK